MAVFRARLIFQRNISCTPDRNCHTFCLGDKIASHPGVLTQAKKNMQNLEINQILGVVVQARSARSSLGLETSI